VAVETRRALAEPSQPPLKEPIEPPENPDMPIREPDPGRAQQDMNRDRDDSKTEIRTVPAVFAQEGLKDRKA
jgi:hypothetical protein